MGASEAFWKIYEFPLHLRHPSVTSLPIHLENNQQVYFDEEANLENIQNNPSPTALKSFFLYNEQNEVGINNDVTYIDFPSKFVWKKESKVWSIRDNQNPSVRIASIGRLPFLTPAHEDVFFFALCYIMITAMKRNML